MDRRLARVFVDIAAQQLDIKPVLRSVARDVIRAVPKAAALPEAVQGGNGDAVRIVIVGEGREDEQPAWAKALRGGFEDGIEVAEMNQGRRTDDHIA